MEGTLASPKIAEINLLNNLEKISPLYLIGSLKVEGYILIETQTKDLEVIIFKALSSSSTHPIEIDLEKKL